MFFVDSMVSWLMFANTSTLRSRPRVGVSPGFSNQRRSPVKGLESSGIGPPSIQQRGGHRAFLDIEIVHVRDFEFAALGWNQIADLTKDRGVIHVDSRDRVVGTRLGGLLLNVHDLAVDQFRDAKALRIGYFF